MPTQRAARRRKAVCFQICRKLPVHRALRAHLGPKPFVTAAQPAEIKPCRKLPCAKNIGQCGLALQPVNLQRGGAALPVKKPWHAPAQGGLLGVGRCGRAGLWLLREQLKRQSSVALQPRTGNKGRKSLPVGNAHIHLAVNTRHARQGLGQSQWHGKWPGQGQGQGRRYLPGTGKTKRTAL